MTLDSQPRTVTGRAIGELRLAIISDAAPERNGVGAYYQDLMGYLGPQLERAEVFSPTIHEGVWQAGVVLPMPGDETQRLCVPNLWSLQRDLASLNPHVVIIPTPGVYGMSGAFLAARRGIPVLTGFHTSFEHIAELYWQGSLTGRVFNKYIEKSHHYLFRVSSAVLVNSTEMEALARQLGASNIRRIGTPIHRVFAQHPVRPFSGEFKRILFAGRLAAEKNIGEIIDAARAMPERSFSFAGDGPLRADVENAAADLPNVSYLGWLERVGLRDEIDAHDCLILPSHFESFGTIALEAMARNRLVVVSPAAGIADWTELAEGLEVIGSEGLSASLEKLAGMSVATRIDVANRAHELAGAFNDRNLHGWENLLLETAGP